MNNISSSFVELNENELQNVDGGIAWALIGLGVVMTGAFAVGVYNGYKSTKSTKSNSKKSKK